MVLIIRWGAKNGYSIILPAFRTPSYHLQAPRPTNFPHPWLHRWIPHSSTLGYSAWCMTGKCTRSDELPGAELRMLPPFANCKWTIGLTANWCVSACVGKSRASNRDTAILRLGSSYISGAMPTSTPPGCEITRPPSVSRRQYLHSPEGSDNTVETPLLLTTTSWTGLEIYVFGIFVQAGLCCFLFSKICSL